MKQLALDEFITFRLLRLTNQFNRQSVKLLARHEGLRLPEWRCIAIVGTYGPQGVNQIASRLSADKGLVSRSLATLEKSGHVAMERDEQDRRQVTVSLTRRGRTTLDRLMPMLRHRQQYLIDALSERELKQLYRTIDKLHAAAHAYDDEFDALESGRGNR